MSGITVYRVLVSGVVWRRGQVRPGRRPDHRGAHTVVAPVLAGWTSWTADATAEPGRDGYGSFCYAGAVRALQAARRAFVQSGVTQVSLRTNQDRTVLVYNRHADGRITCYREMD